MTKKFITILTIFIITVASVFADKFYIFERPYGQLSPHVTEITSKQYFDIKASKSYLKVSGRPINKEGDKYSYREMIRIEEVKGKYTVCAVWYKERS